MNTKPKTILYWGTTILFAAVMVLSAGLSLSGATALREEFAQLGYPGYLLIILGVAKLLGSIALVQNRLPTLREWAYAGFTFDLLGAAASHAFAGHPISVAMVPLIFLGVVAVSYILRSEKPFAASEKGRPNRRLSTTLGTMHRRSNAESV